ncbi:MAG TPA: type IV secretory system conjugative DNA transfer family protein [Solirubrobacteraceae bacterium]|nr:type IV secretory system conjugative DNA transfer family protein [Solirubrobacteraceae bacterium]
MSSSRPAGGGSEVLLGVALGAIVGLSVVVWAWGELAGGVFGTGWPRVGPGQLAVTLVGLPRRLGDPAAAWPPRARHQLPPAGGFYAALGLLVVVVGAIAVSVRRAAGRFGLGSSRAGARWARGGELSALRDGAGVRRPRPGRRRHAEGGGRLVLGRYHGRLLRAEARHALVAFGPPQSGKSAGLAVPALLEWDGPAVASSIKTDLLATTARRRRGVGTTFVFDPFGLSGTVAQTWSPLRAARTWDGALETAWRLAAAGELDQKGVDGGDFWAVAAEQRLAPLLHVAAASDLDMEAVLRWAHGQGTRELDTAVAAMTGAASGQAELDGAHAAYDALRAFEAQADRTRTSIEATVQGLLRAYRFRRVLDSARSAEIDPDTLLDGCNTLYLIGDAKASKLLRPIFLALLGEVVDRAYERATLAGGRLARPLLLCLDEAGNVAPLPNLGEIASTAPSHNIQIVTIFHDLAQARSRYGRQAETVINSHRARMLLPGVADLDTLRYFADLVGEEEIRETSRTTGAGAGGGTRTSSRRRRPLLAAEGLRQLPDRHALLLYGRLPPAVLALRMWFSDRRLRRLGGAA